ncbi:type VII secretion-associated serine protease mycosin [Motilibacter rhizosphaerae]|uniref:Type VII secretion-associated serine protease mycosin n=1 Tax=Motilibacter rhizosphaerae TaxID=598652 RepID=A0A4V2F4S9_9ACTN|nr:type VII secretion-associated serine protease mycosin [Motilibacter rhizosphaerae]RZS90379.1 type VII secretion-associated serine protease mycosin [Motilibacter rhizosphaerae]
MRSRRAAAALVPLLVLAPVLLPGPGARAATRECVRTTSATTPQPWQLSRLQPQRVWALTQGAGITVAVIDSGVDAASVHLRGAVVAGPDVLGRPGGPSTTDCSGHGTAVASLVAGRPVAGSPFEGIAPAARILAVRQTEQVQGAQPRGDAHGLALALRAAVDQGAQVVNVSVTAPGSTPELAAAVQYALSRDVVVVAAAGNDTGSVPAAPDGTPPTFYPAAYPGVLAVGASDQSDAVADVSHPAPYVAVAAPGKDVIAAGANGPGRYVTASGTSFATPLVAGTAALVRAYHPELSARQVVARIVATADAPPQGRTQGLGAGIVDVAAAVTAVLPAEGAAGRPAGHPTPPPVVRAAPRSPAVPVALATAGAGLGLALLAAVATMVLPRGRRRRWQPGRRSGATRPSPSGPGAGLDLLAGRRGLSRPGEREPRARETAPPTGPPSRPAPARPPQRG